MKRILISIEADDFFTPFFLFKPYITNHSCVHLGELHVMMMIAFITLQSNLVPLNECLCAHISYFRFEIIGGLRSHLLLSFWKEKYFKEKSS